jgi:Domain of unknown function (DUF4247)
VAAVSRMVLFVISGLLAVAGATCLYFGVTLLPDVGSYVSSNYQRYAGTGDGARYACSGSPSSVADDLANAQDPDAQASDGKTTYLRYDDNIVTVGPDGNRPCSIRVEGLNGGYSHGTYVFLGPGFYPGSPASGSSGTPGGPDGTK